MYIYYESIVLQTCLFGTTVFPTCFPVCDMFHTCELTGCDGKTFQLNLEIVWHHVDALCCSWNAMEPGWTKACPDKWVSHFGDWRRRGFQHIVWLVCWVGWNLVKLQQPASAHSVEFGELFPAAHTHVASHSRGVIAPQRTPSHSTHLLTDHRTPQKGSYTRKTCADSQKQFFSKNWPEELVLFFFLFGGQMLWNLIIWNMGEIVVFPAFWTVAHTIAFHEILILLTRGGYGNSRLLS